MKIMKFLKFLIVFFLCLNFITLISGYYIFLDFSNSEKKWVQTQIDLNLRKEIILLNNKKYLNDEFINLTKKIENLEFEINKLNSQINLLQNNTNNSTNVNLLNNELKNLKKEEKNLIDKRDSLNNKLNRLNSRKSRKTITAKTIVTSVS